MSQFDFKNPDYAEVYRVRAKRLAALRKDPRLLALVKMHYAKNPADFINDWAMTVDPRVKERSPIMPFLLFPRQVEAIQWIDARYTRGEPGVMVKSRDVGASWVAVAWAVTKCLFTPSFMAGFGSAIKDKVDNGGDPDSLFFKMRMFLEYLPPEFRGGWNMRTDSSDMRLLFPLTGSSIIGSCGDNIGRGGRKSVWFIDESAHLEHPDVVDANLVAAADCRIDMSSVNGTANPFYILARDIEPAQRFNFSWRDDPRKDDEWAAAKRKTTDPNIWKQEYLCDFNALVDGIVIPAEMVDAAIGLHLRRPDIDFSGPRHAALDIADEGRDKCALGSRSGNILDFMELWSGSGMDLAESVSRAVALTEQLGGKEMIYDADGMGANVRGDVRVMKEIRKEKNPRSFDTVRVVPFRGSGAVLWPEKTATRSAVKNKDMFHNYKAQAWWHLYTMFCESLKAHRGEEYDPNLVISIDPKCPGLSSWKDELSQPKWKYMTTGKRIVDKKPEGSASPNAADCIMMMFSPRRGPWSISDGTVQAAGG
jgi:phage terminase large subunit